MMMMKIHGAPHGLAFCTKYIYISYLLHLMHVFLRRYAKEVKSTTQE